MPRSSVRFQMLEAFRLRMYFYLAIVVLVILILLIRIVNIQLIQKSNYLQKSKRNMENNIPIVAPRGEIYDRNFRLNSKNTVLASNRPSFNLTTIPANFPKNKILLNKTMKLLSRLINKPFEEIMTSLNEQNSWERIILAEDVPLSTIVKIATNKDLFPNIDWDNESVRVYNSGNVLFHVIGYVGSISKEELQGNEGYKSYQKIGKSGLESQYNNELRGVDGFVRRIVDVRNREWDKEIGLEPLAGNNLVLTIDSEVQTIASKALDGQRGAVIVFKPATGEILSLVSKPDIDPNLIISRDNKISKELVNSADKPFINRAIQAKYPPASTFKLVTAISALEEEKANPGLSYYCQGYYILKGLVDTTKYCYKSQAHGLNDLYGAIAKSCSVYFYQLGLKAGPTNLFKYADYLGLDEKTGIDLPGEISGFIPSKEWKQRTFGESWYDGDTVNLSIGQGFIDVTAMELVNMLSCIVNNGIVYKPHLVKEIRTPDNSKILNTFAPEKVKEVPISDRTLVAIRTGMRETVRSGTARQLSYLKVPVAGKTGTAQTTSRRKEDKSQHAWFISYGPYNSDPLDTVAIVVLVEYGIAGATSAVPVAGQIYLKLSSLGYMQNVQ